MLAAALVQELRQQKLVLPPLNGPYCQPVFLHRIGAVTFSFGSEANESPRTARSRLFLETNYSNSVPSFVRT